MPKQQPQRPKPPFPEQRQEMSGDESAMDPRPQFEAPAYHASGKLRGKRALITGGDSGIGKAVALLYAKEGADVAIVYLPDDQKDAEETKGLIEAEKRKCLLLPGDVQDPKFCARAVEDTVQQLGGLDILVNNAAYCMFQEGGIAGVSDEQLERTFRTNVFGYFYMARAALPHLKPGGAIVMTGSGAGVEGMPQAVDYAATKAAVHSLVKSLAPALMKKGVRVNAVSPGPVWTPLVQVSQPPEVSAKFGEDTPIGRPAQPDEIAPAYVFLASAGDSPYISGEVLFQLGGQPGPG